MWSYTTNNGSELYHYGIKGMKWGVRRALANTIRSPGYQKLVKKASENKTINKAATSIANKGVANAARKEAISKESDPDVRYGMRRTKGSAEDIKKGLDAANKAIADKKDVSNHKSTEKKKSGHQIRKENRQKIREKAAEAKKQLAKNNQNRILREITEYDKKVGGDYAKKFLSTYDDLEMWDIYSPEELKSW